LSTGAKLLWLELSAWAWDDPVCFPKQELLEFALKASRFSITRWLKELREHKILTVERQQKGNRYVLAEEIPAKVCDPARGVNSKLVALVRGHGGSRSDVADSQHVDAPDEIPMCDPATSDVADLQHDSDPHVAGMQHSNVADLQHASEVHQGKYVHEEEEVDQQEVKRESPQETPASKTSDSSSGGTPRCAREHEGRKENHPNEEISTYEDGEPQVVDQQGFTNEKPPEMQRRRRKRTKRAPDENLVTLPGEGLRTASGDPHCTNEVEVSPPPPHEPEDVLRLLRGEIEEKYGSRACRGIPHDLTKKQRGQLRNAILKKFTPDVVISMIRVLVWDWEVARTTCFPFRHQAPIPTIEAFVQYQEILSSAVTTGLKYDGARRGEWNTYSSRYLQDENPIDDDDPF
jgi:hypothetical protein